tara:strand:+ start:1245 stop:1496 length:252 start_codon:yes stop_codon:yes gene_type:complete
MKLTKKTIDRLNECAEEYFFENDGEDFWVYLNKGFENIYEHGVTSVHLESDNYKNNDYKYGLKLPLTPKQIEKFVLEEICDCR